MIMMAIVEKPSQMGSIMVHRCVCHITGAVSNLCLLPRRAQPRARASHVRNERLCSLDCLSADELDEMDAAILEEDDL